MRYLKADTIYPVTSAPIKNGIIVLDDNQIIVQVLSPDSPNYAGCEAQAELFDGGICPGFINTHCHLELSYLKGKISQYTGLPGFILALQGIRNQFSEEEIEAAIKNAEQEMFDNGIVAVADICNGVASLNRKKKGMLHYHSFVELFAWDEARAEAVFANGLELSKQFSAAQLSHSICAHAPYSCSKLLLKKIAQHAALQGKNLSIHNQECAGENEMFLHKTGALIEALEKLGIHFESWKAPSSNSLESYASEYNTIGNRLFVHNTFSSEEDLQSLKSNNTYLCLCPNANLYIENKLPDVPMLMRHGIQLTVGTDSLASNHQLSCWAELMTIRKQFPAISLNDLLSWATINGARFIGIDKEFGSLEVGKRPGLVHLIEGEAGDAVKRIC